MDRIWAYLTGTRCTRYVHLPHPYLHFLFHCSWSLGSSFSYVDPKCLFENSFTETRRPGGCMEKISDPLFFVNQWVMRKEAEAEQRRLRKQQRKEQRAVKGDKGSTRLKGEKKELQKKQFVQKDYFPDIVIKSKREKLTYWVVFFCFFLPIIFTSIKWEERAGAFLVQWENLIFFS